jgi:competence protein ComGC
MLASIMTSLWLKNVRDLALPLLLLVNHMIFKRNLSRVTLLKLVTTLVIIVMMSVLTVVISDSIATRLYSRAEKDLEQQVNLVKSNIASYNMALLDSAEKMMGLFRLQFPGAFVLDDNQKIDINARQVVALKNGEMI